MNYLSPYKIAMKRSHQRHQRGAVAVEFAMIAPVLFLLLFGLIEFGRASMAFSALEEAARTACRVAILEGTTVEDVEDEVRAVLVPNDITTYDVTTTPVPLASANQWDPITIAITAEYADLSWLPVPGYLGNIQLSASCTLPRESERSALGAP